MAEQETVETVETPEGQVETPENIETPDFETPPELKEELADPEQILDWSDAFQEEEEEVEELEEELEEDPETLPEQPGQTEEQREQSRYSKLKLQLEQRLQEVETREQELAPRLESLARWDRATVDYEQDPVEFVKSTLGMLHNTKDPQQLEEHFLDLMNEMNAHLLGDLAPDDHKQRAAKRKTESEYRKLRNEIESVEKRRRVEEMQRVEAQYQASAGNYLAMNADKYPALRLYAETNGINVAAEIVEGIKLNNLQQLQSGVPADQIREISFADAAAVFEEHIRNEAEAQMTLAEKIRAATQPDQKTTAETEENIAQVRKGKTRSKSRRRGAPPKVRKPSGEDLDRAALSLWTDE